MAVRGQQRVHGEASMLAAGARLANLTRDGGARDSGQVATLPRGSAVVLWALTALFFLRVLGQALVAFVGARFLPPMAEWYSGLVPYPVLLPVQLAMLLVMAKVNADVSRGAGLVATPRPALGRFLRGLSYVYFAAMLLRYVLTVALRPERRWLHGSIPIAFHWVLAGYLWTLGRHHARTRGAA